MYESEEQKFRVLNHTSFTWILLWGMMFLLGVIVLPSLGSNHWTKLLMAVAYSIVVAVIYWMVVRYIPRWVWLNEKGMKIGKLTFFLSEIESISIEGQGKSIRISRKRGMIPISVFPIKSERHRFDKALTNWARRFGVTTVHS